MSGIRSTDTKMEILVRKYLFAQGFRYRKNVKYLPGKPDIVLPKHKTAIFIHGCFWHGHLDHGTMEIPETRHDFWKKKITENVERDKRDVKQLEQMGWKVIIVWECEIQNLQKRKARLESLVDEIKNPIT